MDQVGKIINIKNNIATLSVVRPSGCGGGCKTCGGGCKNESILIETEINDDYSVGDYVEITTENDVAFKHILALYGIPFSILIATIVLFQLVLTGPNKDIISAIASLASLIVSFFIIKLYDKTQMKNNALKFTLGRKL